MILAVIATSSLCDVTEIFTITGELNFLSIYLSLGVLVINPFIILLSISGYCLAVHYCWSVD